MTNIDSSDHDKENQVRGILTKMRDEIFRYIKSKKTCRIKLEVELNHGGIRYKEIETTIKERL